MCSEIMHVFMWQKNCDFSSRDRGHIYGSDVVTLSYISSSQVPGLTDWLFPIGDTVMLTIENSTNVQQFSNQQFFRQQLCHTLGPQAATNRLMSPEISISHTSLPRLETGVFYVITYSLRLSDFYLPLNAQSGLEQLCHYGINNSRK
jgi:hypothetical protein